MRVKITVDAWAHVPDDTPLTVFAMTLQDSPVVLSSILEASEYEVIVHRMRASAQAAENTEERGNG